MRDCLCCGMPIDSAVYGTQKKHGEDPCNCISRLRAALDAAERERDALREQVEAWQVASGLEAGGDPGGVTPAAAERHWQAVEAALARVTAERAEL